MTKPQSEAQRMASEYALNLNEKDSVGFEDDLLAYLAGFKAAVEQAEKMALEVKDQNYFYYYDCFAKNLKKLLEPPSTRQQIKDLLEDV